VSLTLGRAGYDVAMDRPDRERLRRRDAFLKELQEAKSLRERVTPRRARRAKANQLHRMLTYRHC
jgi:hypothetical protein